MNVHNHAQRHRHTHTQRIRKAKAEEKRVKTHTQVPWFSKGETIETNWSSDGLRLKSDNSRRHCRLQDGGIVQGRGESRWRIIAHRRGGREARLTRGGIREHDAFLGHEMRGPAGTGRGGVSMAVGREDQGTRKRNGVRGHRLPSPPCFVWNLLMYFGFLSRWEMLLANIYSVYSYTRVLIYFTFISFIYFIVISNIWFCMLDVIIGRHTWNCQIRTHIHTKIHTHAHSITKGLLPVSRPEVVIANNFKTSKHQGCLTSRWGHLQQGLLCTFYNCSDAQPPLFSQLAWFHVIYEYQINECWCFEIVWTVWVYREKDTARTRVWWQNKLHHTTKHCQMRHLFATHCNRMQWHVFAGNFWSSLSLWRQNTVLEETRHLLNTPSWKTPHHLERHCNTLQHSVNPCNTLATRWKTLQHSVNKDKTSCQDNTATHFNTLQRIATHCNKLQHTATQCQQR